MHTEKNVVKPEDMEFEDLISTHPRKAAEEEFDLPMGDGKLPLELFIDRARYSGGQDHRLRTYNELLELRF
jgi:hypothetical protein